MKDIKIGKWYETRQGADKVKAADRMADCAEALLAAIEGGENIAYRDRLWEAIRSYRIAPGQDTGDQ